MSEIRRRGLVPGEVASVAAGEKPSARILRASRGFSFREWLVIALLLMAGLLLLLFVLFGLEDFVWVGGEQFDPPIQFDEK